MRNFTQEALIDELDNVDWSQYYAARDPTQCWQMMYQYHCHILDKICPEKEFKEVKRKSEWISAELFELMVKRDNLFRDAKKSKDPDKWSEAKEFRNTVNESCKRAKEVYIKCKLNEFEGNPRKFWELLKPLCTSEGKKDDETIKLDGCTSVSETADAFNDFFLNIGVKLGSEIAKLNSDEKEELNKHYDCKINKATKEGIIFKFRRTNSIELELLVKDIKIHKASGVEGISSYLLKMCLRNTLEQLSYLLNLIIERQYSAYVEKGYCYTNF